MALSCSEGNSDADLPLSATIAFVGSMKLGAKSGKSSFLGRHRREGHVHGSGG